MAGIQGQNYEYECKKNAETSFVDCVCLLPSNGAWEMCQQLQDLDRAGVMNFAVRAVALELKDGRSVEVVSIIVLQCSTV